MKPIKYPVLILKQAQDDIREARKYYNKQQKGLGTRFLKAVKAKIKPVSENPLGYQIRYQTVRMAHLSVFPFSIHFELLNEAIVILAVTHSSMNTDKWPKVG
jgi:plasmid stabilization system protein ParE